MPSFPTSVFAPASRSAGQVIQPAHVNDLQDEVNAIEGGYLNGTARLNSSASTVASLDVNGNSTLASSVTLGTIPYVFPSSGGSTGQVLTCVSTSGSTMGLEWRTAATDPTDVVVLTGSTTQMGHASTVAVTWPTQLVALNSSIHSTGTNPERLTPQSSGVYVVSVTLTVVGSLVSTAGMRCQLFDSSKGTFGTMSVGSAGGYAPSISVLGLKRFDVVASTQWVRAVFDQQTGSTLSLNGTLSFCRFYKL